MKNKKIKALSCIFLTVFLIVSFSSTAAAENGSIEFKGFDSGFDFEPGSEYTKTDLFNNFKNVMPGDVLTEKITFKSSAKDCDYINLYMRAQSHSEKENPLSPNVSETGGAATTMIEFLSQLYMKVWNGKELIYSAPPDELNGLKTNQLLGTFRSGDTAVITVELTVPKELGNKYANRIGEVDWIFHAEMWNENQLTVRKLWSDGNENHINDSVTVNLIEDGKIARSEVLNSKNQWVFTFDKLIKGHIYTVEESAVPKGYTVSYNTVGNIVTITNTGIKPVKPGKPVSLSVKKVWSDSGKAHPDFATVTLYNGSAAVETVKLSRQNDWSYQWKELSGDGNWQIVETNIEKGYTPSYSVKDGVVIVTNTAFLIQTGQLNKPIFILMGIGSLLISLGLILMFKKRKKYD